MSDRMWLHTAGWAGHFAYPVEVISRGKKFARVRLLHKTHIGRTWFAAGTVKHRVPLSCLSAYPSRLAYESRGGGRFAGTSAKPGQRKAP